MVEVRTETTSKEAHMGTPTFSGNPHVFTGSQIADPDTINEGFIGEEGITAETMILSELTRNTEATLALAYEQRTANLIAVTETLAVRMHLNEDDLLGHIVPDIRTRLGLDEAQA